MIKEILISRDEKKKKRKKEGKTKKEKCKKEIKNAIKDLFYQVSGVKIIIVTHHHYEKLSS